MEYNIDNQFFILSVRNDTDVVETFERDVSAAFIQLHFCIAGEGSFKFGPQYAYKISDKASIILYNPQRSLPICLEVKPQTVVVSLLIAIEKFHSLFSKDAPYISFLRTENKERKYYEEKEIQPAVEMVLQQIIKAGTNGFQELYLKAKIYELLSLFFLDHEAQTKEYCPFLANEQNVQKIRAAKGIVIERMENPPSLQELANEVGLNIKQLKEGFRKIYGDPVYSFLLNYKLDHARKLLETRQYNVNEVGLKIGYSTSSHFVAAFKKKFGVTPKQYVISNHNIHQ